MGLKLRNDAVPSPILETPLENPELTESAVEYR